ncbi:biotin/lipoate A/B protein ligase family protein [Chamaesiphon sp.]|uniref:lipoate--protein ligase family protein n=1 Tax=Chamaesiphon sp. TaxID=2814140 RepID=UPI003593668A
MSIDRWLLQQHTLGQIPPTLRFYTWSQPTISLGYHQRHYPEHWQSLVWHDSPTERLRQRPVDIVKRPTGGRGVLHQGDLTYALVGSGFVGKRVEVYQQICQFLIDGWRSIGVELGYGTAETGYIHNPNCFGTATSADLVCADGYKLIGSAQLIRSGAVLQHGSMRLNPDLELFERVFGESISLPSAPMLQFTTPQIIGALTKAAESHFQIKLEIQPLSDREWAQISKEDVDL